MTNKSNIKMRNANEDRVRFQNWKKITTPVKSKDGWFVEAHKSGWDVYTIYLDIQRSCDEY